MPLGLSELGGLELAFLRLGKLIHSKAEHNILCSVLFFCGKRLLVHSSALLHPRPFNDMPQAQHAGKLGRKTRLYVNMCTVAIRHETVPSSSCQCTHALA